MAIIATEGLKEICRRVPGLVFDPINHGIIAIESYAPKKETTMNHGRAIKYDIITIEPSDNKGFVVTVGCGTFVYETTGSLLKDLTAFLDDPGKVEEEHSAGRGVLTPELGLIRTEPDGSYKPPHLRGPQE